MLNRKGSREGQTKLIGTSAGVLRNDMVTIFVIVHSQIQVLKEMKIVLISALAIVILFSAIAPNVMASQGYWTANNALVPPGMNKYHIFLDGTYPSSTNRPTKLTNEGLKICVSPIGKWEPSVCHPMILAPSIDNTTIDAGYFIVPDNFVSLNNVNKSVVEVYAKVKYQGIKIGEAADRPVYHLDMNGLVYPEVIVVRSCIEDYHFKLNSDRFNECYRALG